jgi:hypothetical protein
MIFVVSGHLGKGVESISEVEPPIGQILLVPVIGWSSEQ